MNNSFLDHLAHISTPKPIRYKLLIRRIKNARSLTGSRRSRDCSFNHRLTSTDDYESFRLMVELRTRSFYNVIIVTVPVPIDHVNTFNKYICFRNNIQVQRSFKPIHRTLREVDVFHKRVYFGR